LAQQYHLSNVLKLLYSYVLFSAHAPESNQFGYFSALARLQHILPRPMQQTIEMILKANKIKFQYVAAKRISNEKSTSDPFHAHFSSSPTHHHPSFTPSFSDPSSHNRDGSNLSPLSNVGLMLRGYGVSYCIHGTFDTLSDPPQGCFCRTNFFSANTGFGGENGGGNVRGQNGQSGQNGQMSAEPGKNNDVKGYASHREFGTDGFGFIVGDKEKFRKNLRLEMVNYAKYGKINPKPILYKIQKMKKNIHQNQQDQIHTNLSKNNSLDKKSCLKSNYDVRLAPNGYRDYKKQKMVDFHTFGHYSFLSNMYINMGEWLNNNGTLSVPKQVIDANEERAKLLKIRQIMATSRNSAELKFDDKNSKISSPKMNLQNSLNPIDKLAIRRHKLTALLSTPIRTRKGVNTTLGTLNEGEFGVDVESKNDLKNDPKNTNKKQQLSLVSPLQYETSDTEDSFDPSRYDRRAVINKAQEGGQRGDNDTNLTTLAQIPHNVDQIKYTRGTINDYTALTVNIIAKDIPLKVVTGVPNFILKKKEKIQKIYLKRLEELKKMYFAEKEKRKLNQKIDKNNVQIGVNSPHVDNHDTDRSEKYKKRAEKLNKQREIVERQLERYAVSEKENEKIFEKIAEKI
jgi:hypothetical protein